MLRIANAITPYDIKRAALGGVPYKSDLAAMYTGVLLQESGLTYLKDYSGNDYHALAKDSGLFTYIGNYVNLGNTIDLGTNDFSVEIEMYSNTSPKGTLLSNVDGIYYTSQTGFAIRTISGSGAIALNIVSPTSGLLQVTGTTNVKSSNYFKVLVSLDRDSMAKIYVNDVLDGVGSIASEFTRSMSLNDLVIAAFNTYTTAYGTTLYKSMKIFGEVVTPETAKTSTNILAQYSFNEGEGNTVYDVSGNGNHGTIYGTKYGDITGTFYSLSQYSSFWNYLHGAYFDGTKYIPALADGSGLAADGTALNRTYKNKLNNLITSFNAPLSTDLKAVDAQIVAIEGDGYIFNAAGTVQKDISHDDVQWNVYENGQLHNLIFAKTDVNYAKLPMLIYKTKKTFEESLIIKAWLEKVSKTILDDSNEIVTYNGQNITIMNLVDALIALGGNLQVTHTFTTGTASTWTIDGSGFGQPLTFNNFRVIFHEDGVNDVNLDLPYSIVADGDGIHYNIVCTDIGTTYSNVKVIVEII